MHGLRSNSGLFWAPKKAGGRPPLLMFSPLLGTPKKARVVQEFWPLLGPREGRGEAATSDFGPFVWGPRECTGYVAVPACFGPPRRQEE